MIFNESQIQGKMLEMKEAIDQTNGMGIGDDVHSVSEQTLRQLAIQKLDSEIEEQVNHDIARVTKEIQAFSDEPRVTGIPCVSEEQDRINNTIAGVDTALHASPPPRMIH